AIDRGASGLRLPHGRWPAALQQEHRAADTSAEWLAGEEALGRPSAPYPGMPPVAASPPTSAGRPIGRDGWAVLALVMGCSSRELLGWHLSRSGKSRTAEVSLEQLLIARFGTLGRVPHHFPPRS